MYSFTATFVLIVRFFGASILLVLVLSIGLHNIIIQTVFNINQSRIARTLCVEKEVKDSKCGGCCQLKKTLAHENTDEGNIPVEQKQSEMLYYSPNEGLYANGPKFVEGVTSKFYYGSQPLAEGVCSSVFYPPDFI